MTDKQQKEPNIKMLSVLYFQVQKQAQSILCEHQAAIQCVAVSADLDTVVSGSYGQLYVHTTFGDLVSF